MLGMVLRTVGVSVGLSQSVKQSYLGCCHDRLGIVLRTCGISVGL